jgi:hypothetical protein
MHQTSFRVTKVESGNSVLQCLPMADQILLDLTELFTENGAEKRRKYLHRKGVADAQ